MSTQTHLATLKRRHQTLEQELCGEQLNPSWGDLKIAELKRRKLLVKDEIANLEQRLSARAAKVRLSATQKKETAVRMAKRKASSWYEGATRAISITEGKSH